MGNLDSMREDEDDDDLEVLSVVCSQRRWSRLLGSGAEIIVLGILYI